MTPNLWNNTYTLFLFDRQLIYCKKDLLKRTQYIFKGRIFLDNCRILNLPDGKMFGVSLKNALRIYCDTKTKWFDFCFRSSSSKLRFLNTLSAERQFCGENLFVSELAGPVVDDDDLTDSEIHCTTEAELNERAIDNLHILSGNTPPNFNELRKMSAPSSTSSKKFSETLPHKLKKHSTASYDFNSTNSLGRRKIGKWFRKTKSTNSTPSQSPTYQPVAASTPPGISDSSSQSSPGMSSNRRQTPATKVNPTQKTKNSLTSLT
jgi:Rho guanine nucleotide exchange factor 4/29